MTSLFCCRLPNVTCMVQESYYNFGRACHQIGLKFVAVEYYNKALAAESVSEGSDLTRVIAYNLMMLYKSAGNAVMARSIMRQYLTI